MSANSPGLQIGGKVRRLRRQRKLSQANLAAEMGISASYLNLIEHNRRNITVPILLKMAGYFGLEINDLAESDEAQIANDLMEVFNDDIFADLDITNLDLRDLASSSPNVAKAVLHLFDKHQALKKYRAGQSAPVKGEIAAGGASEAVSDFIQSYSNYFPSLEAAAARVCRDTELVGAGPAGNLVTFLLNAFGVSTRFKNLQNRLSRKYDAERKLLLIHEGLSPESRNFQIAQQVALLAARPEIDALVEEGNFPGNDARALATGALAAVCASAILMPYEKFLVSAQMARYDVDLLSRKFAVSFEQVCHRLTGLQKPGAKGLPFHMMRTDIAGNISKRFSLSGIHIPRHSGACPRWNVYTAFLQPGKINIQLSQMPDGKKFFCIARTLVKGEKRHGAALRHLSIGLGCDIIHARKMVYSDGISLDDPASLVPIGVSCRTCPRLECSERAFPPSNHQLDIDVNKRGVSAYVSVE